MRQLRLSAPQLAGVLVSGLGLTLAAGWLLQSDVLARLLSGAGHRDVVSAMLFIATGLCFFNAAANGKRVWLRPLSWLAIGALLLLPLAYLLQSLIQAQPGIEIARPDTPLVGERPLPGRLSANASLGFLLTGIAFWLAQRPLAGRRGLAYLWAAAGVSAIGMAGLAGHFIGIEHVYAVADFTGLRPAKALGLLVVGAGLWTLHDKSRPESEPIPATERRINRRNLVVVTLVALSGGVAGFAVMRDTFETSVAQNLSLTATTNATSMAHALEVSLSFPRAVATRPAVGQTLTRLTSNASDPDSLDFLQKAAGSFMTAEISSAEFYNAAGQQVLAMGTSVRARASVTHPLKNARQQAALVWADGYVLVTYNTVFSNGERAGRLVIEQRMPLFDRLLEEIRKSGETTDAALCTRDHDDALCGPTRLRREAFMIPMFDAKGDPTLPINRALLGERGVQRVKDRRGTEIVSAFVPLGDYGLGFAVKTDVQTLYAPLRARVNVLVAVVASIIALAIYVQRRQVRPVLARFVASKQRLRAILEDQSELVSLARPSGELTYVNPAYARHFDLQPSDMVGKNLFDYVVPDDVERVRRVMASVLAEGEPMRNENRMLSAGGAVRWVSWMNRAHMDPETGLPLLHSVGRDITEQKRAEAALRASQARLERTERVAGVGGWEWEPRTGHVEWTDEVRRLLEVGPNYVPTIASMVSFCAQERRSGLLAALDSVSTDGTPLDTELPFVTAGGLSLWVHVQAQAEREDGRPVRVVGAMQDVTERRTLQQRVAESERFMRQVSDSLPIRIAYLDRQARFRFVNRAQCRRFGLPRETIIGRTYAELTGGLEPQALTRAVKAVLAGQDQQLEYDEVVEGERVRIECRLIPDIGDDGRVRGFYATGIDVTERSAAERALQESEARIRTIADALPMRVAYIDADERYRFNNLAYERAFGKPRSEIYGRTVREVVGPAAYLELEPSIRKALRGESVVFEGELTARGSTLHYEAHYIPQYAADGTTVLGFHAVVTDITRQKREERRLIELSRIDVLTRTMNRAGFDIRLSEAMERSRVNGTLMALMYLDIDRFKQINDRLGHQIGDALLRAFAERLSNTLRSADSVARLGGDEFTVIMERLPAFEVASRIADKLVAAMRAPFLLDGQPLQVTASIGMAFYQGGATTPSELVKEADAMLYEAKGAGRNNYRANLRVIQGGRRGDART